jgi:hypothetical protein
MLLDAWRKDRHLTAEQSEHVKTVVVAIEDEARADLLVQVTELREALDW